jgi:4-cresol dehydrogenase (hydroxylating)
MLDLTRMNRILEVNEELGYALLEPGVGFNDLFAYLQMHRLHLWMSAPAQTWGSVVGNALERGVGYTSYGDHASKVCGMEIVLANGRVVRTGMGAIPGATAWQLFKYGFGPSWEGAFMQSNLGIVSKMGLWLMPEPEASLTMTMSLPGEDDIGPAVEALRPLKLSGVVQANPSFANVIRSLALKGPRDTWYQGEGPIPRAALEEARIKAGVGWWNFSIRLFGLPEVNSLHANVVKRAFAAVTPEQFKITEWHRGEPIEQSGAAIPSLAPLNVVNWLGGRGGHLTFSPVSPPRANDALKQFRMARDLYARYGFDYYGGFTAGERYLNHITMIIFDRDNAHMTAQAHRLFSELVKTAAREGYGEYRTHVLFYDEVAQTYSWNDSALMHLNQTVKDALDPVGIIAPGKMGVWPSHMRPPKS